MKKNKIVRSHEYIPIVKTLKKSKPKQNLNQITKKYWNGCAVFYAARDLSGAWLLPKASWRRWRPRQRASGTAEQLLLPKWQTMTLFQRAERSCSAAARSSGLCSSARRSTRSNCYWSPKNFNGASARVSVKIVPGTHGPRHKSLFGMFHLKVKNPKSLILAPVKWINVQYS